MSPQDLDVPTKNGTVPGPVTGATRALGLLSVVCLGLAIAIMIVVDLAGKSRAEVPPGRPHPGPPWWVPLHLPVSVVTLGLWFAALAGAAGIAAGLVAVGRGARPAPRAVAAGRHRGHRDLHRAARSGHHGPVRLRRLRPDRDARPQPVPDDAVPAAPRRRPGRPGRAARLDQRGLRLRPGRQHRAGGGGRAGRPVGSQHHLLAQAVQRDRVRRGRPAAGPAAARRPGPARPGPPVVDAQPAAALGPDRQRPRGRVRHRDRLLRAHPAAGRGRRGSGPAWPGWRRPRPWSGWPPTSRSPSRCTAWASCGRCAGRWPAWPPRPGRCWPCWRCPTWWFGRPALAVLADTPGRHQRHAVPAVRPCPAAPDPGRGRPGHRPGPGHHRGRRAVAAAGRLPGAARDPPGVRGQPGLDAGLALPAPLVRRDGAGPVRAVPGDPAGLAGAAPAGGRPRCSTCPACPARSRTGPARAYRRGDPR